MERVLIIGCPGAGKSTFAVQLAEKTGLPLVHLDRLYWCGNWEHRSREEFDILLQAELENPRWIIDGNFNRTIPHRLQYCDHVFFLDIPTVTCLWGVTKRVFQSHGKTRPDMGGNCPERFDKQKPELYRAVLRFRKEHRKNYLQMLADSGANVTIFKSRKQIRKYLKNCK